MSKAIDKFCLAVENDEVAECASQPENPACDVGSVLTLMDDVCKLPGLGETTVCETIEGADALNSLKNLMLDAGEESNPLADFCEAYDVAKEADRQERAASHDVHAVSRTIQHGVNKAAETIKGWF